jgi:cyanophycinase-like exopeptidase
MKFRLILIAILLGFFTAVKSQAQTIASTQLLLTGGENAANYATFSQTVISSYPHSVPQMVILPVLLASDAEQISAEERSEAINILEAAKVDLETVCRQALAQATDCSVRIIPVFTREDAKNPDHLKMLQSETNGIYLLGNHAQVGWQVIADTPIQTALNQAYNNGVIIAGSLPGLFSQSLVQASPCGAHIDSVFDFGALSLSADAASQTMAMNLPKTILLNEVYQQDRIGALLHAVSLSGEPLSGIGLDSDSAAIVSDQRLLQSVSGDAPVLILDAHTFHAAQSVRYTSAFQPIGTSNILAHWLAPGETTYDITTRQLSSGAVPTRIARNPQPLRLPSGAGQLFLSADLSETPGLNASLADFINLAGGRKANLLLATAGYEDPLSVQKIGKAFERALGNPIQTLEIPASVAEPLSLPAEITGIILSAPPEAQIDLQQLQSVAAKWRSGLPVWVHHGAVAWVGESYLQSSLPNESPATFLQTPEQVKPGLNWLPVALQTRIWDENHWSELYSLAYYRPQNLVVGIPSRSGIALSNLGARVWGEDVVLTLDFSQATLAEGSTANSLIDIFAPFELVAFRSADQNAAPVAVNTPVLPTATFTQQVVAPTYTLTPTAVFTATPIPTETQRIRPTATIKPTRTPPSIPPPPDPARMNFMVVITLIMVAVILFGVWLNRHWINHNH